MGNKRALNALLAYKREWLVTRDISPATRAQLLKSMVKAAADERLQPETRAKAQRALDLMKRADAINAKRTGGPPATDSDPTS